MLKFATFTVLFLPSILATLSSEEMASALIAAEDSRTLKETFKKYEKEQDDEELTGALADVAKVQARIPKVVACLRMAHDPFLKDKMCVSELVHTTFFHISRIAADTESFTNVITSFKPSDIKPLASIRFWILDRKDVVNVLKGVMKKSPELIIDDLPRWLALHDFRSRF